MQPPNQRIDANNFAIDVDQRPPTVARIDVRVGLNEILVHRRAFKPPNNMRAALGADVPESDAVIQLEGSADGDGKFAHVRFI